MATKSFKDICVEYAHQLGKGLPLTPAEMCNAVIMYLNAQITEMKSITTALQTAVTEAEESASEATSTATALSGKVDTLQTAVTEAESNATEAINKSNSALETVNALTKVPKPTTSDNGKVIGVQSGEYALVEQSGGEAPANMVTTDTRQVMTNRKGIAASFYTNNSIQFYDVSNEDVNKLVNGYPPSGTFTRTTTIQPGHISFTATDGNASRSLTLSGGTDGLKPIGFTDYGNADITFNRAYIEVYKYTASDKSSIDRYTYGYPFKSGMLAVEGDIPNLDNYDENIDIINGTGGNGIRVHDTANTSPYTKYGYDKIETYGNSNVLQYTLNIPNKDGTLALTGEIDEAITNILNSENTWSKTNKFGRGVDVTGQIDIHNSDTSIERDGTLIVGGSMVYLQNYKVNEYYYAATLNNSQYNVDENILGSVDYFIDGIYLTPLTSDKTNIDTERGYLLKFPDKGGTIALTSDIPTPVTKYFTRVMCTDSNTNTQYIFSCITNDDLSGNNVYGDVVSLLTELGAINQTSALPCCGKAAAGGVVIGVYTDGSAITAFDGDNVTEEIPTSAEINVISR